MDRFLATHSTPKGTEYTHTSMMGGIYQINTPDLDKFYELYAATTLNPHAPPLYLTEKHNPIGGPCVMDFDFRYEVNKGEEFARIIDKKTITQIVEFIDQQIKELIGFGDNRTCVVLQRPEPYIKKNLADTCIWSDGLHIQFPFICCDYAVQHLIRKRFIEKFTFDPDVQGMESLDKIYDKAVIQSNNWCMYGSTKQGLAPYAITLIYGKPRSDKTDWKQLQKSEDLSDRIKLVKLLSIQKTTKLIDPVDPSLFIVEQAKKLVRKAKLNHPIVQKICGKNIVPIEIIKGYLGLLSAHRADAYDKWIQIGMIVHNCADQTDQYLKTWTSWSRQSNRYEQGVCQEKWNTFGSNGTVGLGSLIYYAQKDCKDLIALRNLRVQTYIHNYKTNFNLDGYEIESIQLNTTHTKCIVMLKSDNCPFNHRNKCTSNPISMEVVPGSLQLNCKTCGACRSVRLSHKVCQNIFGLDMANQKVFELEDLAHTSDILLTLDSAYVFDHVIKTESKYIEYDDRMSKSETLIVHSQPGTGKTTLIKKIVKKYKSNPTILSVVSRQTMAAIHSSGFGFQSYLDKKKISSNQFIISFEQLHKIERDTYDILILDEINSLILHTYSTTMDKTRRPSFSKLVQLVRDCKKLIVCDAAITDMVLEFVMSVRADQETLFYHNTFKNRLNIPLDIYFRQNNSVHKELELFCKPMIKAVRNKESMMIVGDTKEILMGVRTYLAESVDMNADEIAAYFRVYTQDVGDVKDFENCNKLWKNKCVIMSPKVVYGIDVLIPYKEIYAIYSSKTIDGFSMHQQTSRARAAAKLNVLFLTQTEQQVKDTFMTFEQSCQIENTLLNDFMTRAVNKFASNPLFDLGSVTMKSDGYVVNDESIFGKIHMRAAWYKKLFIYNKAFLFRMLCAEQGYVIRTIIRERSDTPTKFACTKEQLIEEMIEQTYKIIDEQNDKSTKKKKNVIEAMCEEKPPDLIDLEQRREYITHRLKGIKELLNVTTTEICADQKLKEIVADERRFERAMKSRNLYYTPEEVKDREATEITNNFGHIQKSRRLFRQLSAIRYIEKVVGHNRFRFQRILDYDDVTIQKMVKRFTRSPHLLQHLSLKCSEKRRIKEILNRLAKIKHKDQLAKFCMAAINQFDRIYSYKSERSGKKQIVRYKSFCTHSDLIRDHIKIMNLLHINPGKLRPGVRRFITHGGFDDDDDPDFNTTQ